MSADHPDPDDRALDSMRRSLIDELATSLDLAAGLADATRAAPHLALTADLAEQLDLAGGLAAVLATQCATAGPGEVVAGTPGAGVDPGRVTDPARLLLRGDPTFHLLRAGAELAHAVADVRAHLAVDLGHALDDTRPRHHSFHLTMSMDYAHALRSTFSSTAPGFTDRFRTRCGRTVDEAYRHARNLDHSHTVDGARRHAVALDEALARILTDVVGGMDADIGGLGRVHGHAVTLLDTTATGDPAAVHRTAAEQQRSLADLRDRLTLLGDDFVGADLRTPLREYEAVRLTGIRWSPSSTRWPEAWEERVRAASFEIGDGVFEVVGTSGAVDRSRPVR